MGAASKALDAGATGVAGGVSLLCLTRASMRFFSSVRRKTLIVVRRDLCGLQSSAATGVCSHTGQEDGSVEWPCNVSNLCACTAHIE
jgi:hypothetical protein